MNAILKNPIVAQYFVTLEELLNAGTSHAKAVKALIPVFNKASKAEQDIIRNKVAELIGRKYGVKPKVMEKGINKGLLGFNAHGTKAESNARDFMRDNFSVSKPVVGKKPTSKTTRKSVDPVQADAKRLKAKYSKTEIKRLIKALTENA